MSEVAGPSVGTYVVIAGIAFALGLFVGVFWNAFAFGPWLRALMSGGRVSLFHVIGMRLRGTPVNLIVEAYTSLIQAGESPSLAEVESLYIANRSRVQNAAGLVEIVRSKASSQS